MASNKKRDPVLSFFLRYMAIALLLAAVFGSLLFVIYKIREKNVFDELAREEIVSMDTTVRGIQSQLSFVISDLHVISSLPALKVYLDDPSEENYNYLLRMLALFSEHRNVYDQIRFLDMQGMEVARVNNHAGLPIAVNQSMLQDKSSRDYFVESIGMVKDQIYISTMELNIEYGVIDLPFKPVVRFAICVYDNQGEKRGLLVLNLLGQRLLETFVSSHPSISSAMLLNADGYYLFNENDPNSTWGFMLPGREDKSFFKDYPDVWQVVKQWTDEQYRNKAGLFTYQKFSPIDFTVQYNMGNEIPRVLSQPSWHIVTFISEDKIRANMGPVNLTFTWLSISILVTVLGFSGLITKGMLDLQREQRELRFNAFHDQLTKLPNRVLLYDRLRQAQLRLVREKSRFSVFLLDLDGFKQVNDTHGHDAGDELLRQVSARIQNQIRDTDTLARLGGDEFCIIANGLETEASALQLAGRILSAINEPVIYNNAVMRVNASIGITIQDDPERDFEEVLNEADKAMYRAKNQGKGQAVVFQQR